MEFQHQLLHHIQHPDLLQHQLPILHQLLQQPLQQDQHLKVHQILLLLLFLGMFYIYKHNVFNYKHCMFVLCIFMIDLEELDQVHLMGHLEDEDELKDMVGQMVAMVLRWNQHHGEI